MAEKWIPHTGDNNSAALKLNQTYTQTYFNLLLDLAPISTWSISAFFVWIVFFIAVASWKKNSWWERVSSLETFSQSFYQLSFQSDEDSNLLYWVKKYNLLRLKMYGSEITLLCLQAIDKQIHVIILEHIISFWSLTILLCSWNLLFTAWTPCSSSFILIFWLLDKQLEWLAAY